MTEQLGNEILGVAVESGIATVTLNRPQAMNALSRALRVALGQAMAALDRDPAVRVVILTGAGTRAFTAGLDLRELGADPNAVQAANAAGPNDNPVLAVEQCRKPVIGAINGAAITGGFELALACDVLIASVNARFADTHARVGLLPGWGLSQRLSRLIGIYRARELAFTGNFLDAQTACAWGLVNRVVEADALMPAAQKLAADMASADNDILIDYKKLIGDGFDLPMGEAMRLEASVSSARNSRVTPGELEARREVVQARGRAQ
jgi:enoyl-CoA hydratase